MKNVVLFLGTAGAYANLCALTPSRAKTPGKIVGYVDRKQLGEMSEAWHRLSTSVTKKQSALQAAIEKSHNDLQAAVDKQKNELEATFSTMSINSHSEELSREKIREEFTAKFNRIKENAGMKDKRMQEDASRELQAFVASTQQKVERMDEQAKKEVMNRYNARVKDAADKLGSLVDKTPGVVISEDNDFTAEVAEAFDTIAEKDNSSATSSREQDLREKMSKKLFLADAEKVDSNLDDANNSVANTRTSERIASKTKSAGSDNAVLAERANTKVLSAKDLEALIKPAQTQIAENTLTAQAKGEDASHSITT